MWHAYTILLLEAACHYQCKPKGDAPEIKIKRLLSLAG